MQAACQRLNPFCRFGASLYMSEVYIDKLAEPQNGVIWPIVQFLQGGWKGRSFLQQLHVPS
jgi:hypothetical protein